jgi:hypothetical protein
MFAGILPNFVEFCRILQGKKYKIRQCAVEQGQVIKNLGAKSRVPFHLSGGTE